MSELAVEADVFGVSTRDNTRITEVLNLRIMGLSYPEIANMMNRKYDTKVQRKTVNMPNVYTAAVVSRDICEALEVTRNIMQETAQKLIEIEDMRLDTLYASNIGLALEGSVKHANLILRISERRAKLHGLDKVNVNVTDWRTQIIDLLKSGRISIESVRKELGDDLFRELANTGGIFLPESKTTREEAGSDFIEGSFAEVASVPSS